MKTTERMLNTILDIAISLSKETDKTGILNTILTYSMQIANCDAGTLYVLHEDGLRFFLMKTLSQGIDRGGDGETIGLPPVQIRPENISAYTVLSKQPVRIDDAYASDLFDFSGPKKYDRLTGYRTGSILAVPLINQEDEVIGVIQLINALDGEGRVCPFSEDSERIIFALSSMAAIMLSNIKYMDELREMMWSFTEAMAEAIDERSQYNANHIRSVARYAGMIADHINCLHAEGKTDEYFDDKRKDGLIMSAWLHDIGKLVIPLDIMDKPTRLGERKAVIEQRFQLLACKYEILCLKGILTEEAFAAKQEELAHVRALVDRVNVAEFLTDERLAELQAILNLTYDCNGEVIPYFDEYEKVCLTVRKGTLTAAERDTINSHVDAAEKILAKVHFNSYFKNSPTFAVQHHEYLNGGGYPHRLTAEQLPLESRILTVADIYDALTADDRPYKKAKTRDVAIAILKDMASHGQLDETVCAYLDEATL